MANFFTDNEDLRWYFDHGIDWDSIVRATEYDFQLADGCTSTEEAVELYRDIATMVGEFVAEQIAPHTAEIDHQGVNFADGEASFPPRLAGIFKQIKDLELHGMCLPRELGGMNIPMLMYYINAELMARADVSVMAHHGFHGGIALALLAFSVFEGTTEFDAETLQITKTRFRNQIDEIVAGKAWGCMDITESDAGSDMAALRCVGEQTDQGNWVVSGSKIFITSGHGKYHFVIARTEKAADPDDPFGGLAGLSFFLVQTYSDNADGTRTWHCSVDRLEEKIGHHGSVTASLTFDRTPALLLGERGDGFKQMLVLMNNARIGVGFEALGMCETAHRMAAAYAAERPSMGKTIDRHELIADMLDEMQTDILGIRAMAMHGAHHQELAEKLQLRLEQLPPEGDLDRQRLQRRVKSHQRKARRATPLLKYLAAEKSVEMARKCLQIHGGNGYSREYGAEKLLRDALVMPIYEGTSQIQALMAMKDTLGAIMKNPQAFVRRRAQAQWRSVSARDGLERRVARLQSLSLGAQQHLITRTATDKVKSLAGKPITSWPTVFLKSWDPKRDFAFAMLHAERLVVLLADELICELLLEQAHQDPARREVLERYLERAEPRCRYLADEIATTGARILSQLGADELSSEQSAG